MSEFKRSQSLAEKAEEMSASLEHPSTIGALDPLRLEDKVMLCTSFQKSVSGLRECNTQSLSDYILILPLQSVNFILATFLGLFLDLKKHSRSRVTAFSPNFMPKSSCLSKESSMSIPPWNNTLFGFSYRNI